jgi:hypothetical protein
VKEKDVKVDLFYISLFSEIQIQQVGNSPNTSFLGKQTLIEDPKILNKVVRKYTQGNKIVID